MGRTSRGKKDLDTARKARPNPMPKVVSALQVALSRAFHWLTLVIWFGCSLLATYSGPFGTYGDPSVLHSLLIWMVLIGSSIVTVYVLNALNELFLAKLSSFIRIVVFIGVSAIATGSLVHFLLIYVFAHTSDPILSRSELSSYSLAVISFIHIVRLILPFSVTDQISNKGASEGELSSASLPPHSRLAKRLDIPAGVRISQITANGHFVSVETSEDVYRTRMRFSDAVAELDGIYGLTVHRSHWVHRNSIVGWVPRAKKPYVLLNNDRSVPISKTYLANVKNAGLTILDPEDVEVEQSL